MPRKRGVPNRRASQVICELTEKHKFSVLGELVRIFERNKTILQSMYVKMEESMELGDKPLAAFTPEEINFYNSMTKDQVSTLMKLCRFIYPTLKSLAISDDGGDKVVFNISTLGTLGTVARTPPDNVVPIDKKKTGTI